MSSNNGKATFQWHPIGIIDNYSTYFDFPSGSTIEMFKNNASFVCDVYFRIINKSTGEIVHIKKVNFTGSGTSISSSNVTNYDSTQDFDNNNGYSDNTGVSVGGSSLGSSYSNTDSVMQIIQGEGDVFDTIKTILNMFPSWITTPIFFFLSSLITIAIIKKLLD